MDLLTKIWSGPGEFGIWTDPTGYRHWLYPEDQPFRHRDSWMLLRVCRGAWQPLFGGTVWSVLLSGPEPAPYHQIGSVTAPERLTSDRWWHARQPDPTRPTGLLAAGSFLSLEEAVHALLERELGTPHPPVTSPLWRSA